MRTYVLLALMVMCGSVGNTLLGKGMKQLGELNQWSVGAVGGLFFRALGSGTIWLGIATLLLFFVFYLIVLSWADYSYVSPATAAGYAVVVLLSYWVLGEKVSPLRWAGVAIIGLGVILVGGTPPATGEGK